MKMLWSTLYVKDLDQTIDFYQAVLGINVDRRFKAGPDVEIAFLGNGETKIEFICDQNKKLTPVGPDISWGFAIESMDETINHLKQLNITIISGPIKPNPYIQFIYIEDPNGLKIQLIEEIHQ